MRADLPPSTPPFPGLSGRTPDGAPGATRRPEPARDLILCSERVFFATNVYLPLFELHAFQVKDVFLRINEREKLNHAEAFSRFLTSLWHFQLSHVFQSPVKQQLLLLTILVLNSLTKISTNRHWKTSAGQSMQQTVYWGGCLSEIFWNFNGVDLVSLGFLCACNTKGTMYMRSTSEHVYQNSAQL